MAIQPVSNLVLSSDPGYQGSGTLVTLSAAGRSGGIIGQVYIQGSASGKVISSAGGKILWRTVSSTWATAGSTVRVGIQDVDPATGLEDLTYDVNGDLVQGVNTIAANSWQLTNMTTGSKTLSDGDLIAIVISLPVRNGVDSVAVTSSAFYSGLFPDQSIFGFPYGTTNTGALAKANNAMLYAIIVFNDGTLGWIFGVSPILTTAGPSSIAYNSGSSPDEYIGTFTPNYRMQISSIAASLSSIAVTDFFDVILYRDPFGTPTVVQTLSASPIVNTNAAASITPCIYRIPPTTLTPGVTYGIAVRPTTVNSITWGYTDLQSSANAAVIKGIMPLPSLKMAGRTDQTGAFVETNAQHCPLIGMNVCGLDDGVSSGAAGGSFVFAG